MEDGSFVRHVATELAEVRDVEECEGGWLVASWDSNAIEFVSGDDSSGEPPADGVTGVGGRGWVNRAGYPSAVIVPCPWYLAWAWSSWSWETAVACSSLPALMPLPWTP